MTVRQYNNPALQTHDRVYCFKALCGYASFILVFYIHYTCGNKQQE